MSHAVYNFMLIYRIDRHIGIIYTKYISSTSDFIIIVSFSHFPEYDQTFISLHNGRHRIACIYTQYIIIKYNVLIKPRTRLLLL